jgi:hypothetical protein
MIPYLGPGGALRTDELSPELQASLATIPVRKVLHQGIVYVDLDDLSAYSAPGSDPSEWGKVYYSIP